MTDHAQIESVLPQLTQAIRDADEMFETSGGGTRHYIRECLDPMLEKQGLAVVSLEVSRRHREALEQIAVLDGANAPHGTSTSEFLRSIARAALDGDTAPLPSAADSNAEKTG